VRRSCDVWRCAFLRPWVLARIVAHSDLLALVPARMGEILAKQRGARLFCWRASNRARAITVAVSRRISNGALSCGLYRGPRTSSLRNKAVCKDAVCSLTWIAQAAIEDIHETGNWSAQSTMLA
jgi:hypothetical protein